MAAECISVVLSGMFVLSGGWFLHRIGISIIYAILCFVREMQTIIQTSASPWFPFGLYFPYKTKVGMSRVLQTSFRIGHVSALTELYHFSAVLGSHCFDIPDQYSLD